MPTEGTKDVTVKASEVQLFPNKGMALFCDTFSCFEPAKWFVGRPDGPYNLLANLCDNCKESLIRSIILADRDGVRRRIDDIESEEALIRDKEMYDGREFPCKICGEVFYSPTALATHTRVEHPKGKRDE